MLSGIECVCVLPLRVCACARVRVCACAHGVRGLSNTGPTAAWIKASAKRWMDLGTITSAGVTSRSLFFANANTEEKEKTIKVRLAWIRASERARPRQS